MRKALTVALKAFFRKNKLPTTKAFVLVPLPLKHIGQACALPAASDHEALLPQIVVASTGPAGMLPPTNCMPTQPTAISETAIHTPPHNRTVSSASRSSEISTSSIIA